MSFPLSVILSHDVSQFLFEKWLHQIQHSICKLKKSRNKWIVQKKKKITLLWFNKEKIFFNKLFSLPLAKRSTCGCYKSMLQSLSSLLSTVDYFIKVLKNFKFIKHIFILSGIDLQRLNINIKIECFKFKFNKILVMSCYYKNRHFAVFFCLLVYI